MYNYIFNSKSKTITSAAGILAVAALISGLLGLFRDRLLAGNFGAGDELDIYYGAADTSICLAKAKISELVDKCLEDGPVSYEYNPRK